MADDQHEVRHINWTQVLGFTQIFKSFKMAIHPSKMALSLAAIVVVFILGWTMDRFWSAAGQYAGNGEILSYVGETPARFEAGKQQWLESRLPRAKALYIQAETEKYYLDSYKAKLKTGPSRYLSKAFDDALRASNEALDKKRAKPFVPPSIGDLAEYDDYNQLLDKAADRLDDEVARIRSILHAAKAQAKTDIAAALKGIDKSRRDEARKAMIKAFVRSEQLAERAITDRKVEVAARIRNIRGQRIFASLLAYERRCVANALSAAWSGNIFGRIGDYPGNRPGPGTPAEPPEMAQFARAFPATGAAGAAGAGFLLWCLLAAQGIFWLVTVHCLYAVIFLLTSLAVVAFFGGAVHRIAALHFTREEKISIVDSLRFSCGKFVSYFTAPLIPLAVIVGLGVAFLTVGGLVGSIWYIGSVIMGLLFFLALAVGLVIAFLAVGLVAGGPLMYPTIAVEGSDSFDAISRSFSYVFARPWRAALYGLVALVYGAITYAFVRLFIYLAMAATHMFVGWGVIGGGQAVGSQADKLDIMWPAPTYQNLTTTPNWQAMSGWTTPFGAWLLSIWVFLLAAVVLAYLLSFAASSTTVIYCLLRRKVDATDLDDVYIEESPEEDFSPEAQESQQSPEAPETSQTPAEPKAGQDAAGQEAVGDDQPGPEDTDQNTDQGGE